jgi:hypothetical protein
MIDGIRQWIKQNGFVYVISISIFLLFTLLYQDNTLKPFVIMAWLGATIIYFFNSR